MRYLTNIGAPASQNLHLHASAVREMMERAWSPKTAYQGITLESDDVPSRGRLHSLSPQSCKQHWTV